MAAAGIGVGVAAALGRGPVALQGTPLEARRIWATFRAHGGHRTRVVNRMHRALAFVNSSSEFLGSLIAKCSLCFRSASSIIYSHSVFDK